MSSHTSGRFKSTPTQSNVASACTVRRRQPPARNDACGLEVCRGRGGRGSQGRAQGGPAARTVGVAGVVLKRGHKRIKEGPLANHMHQDQKNISKAPRARFFI